LAFDGFSIIDGGMSVAEGLMIAACLLFISLFPLGLDRIKEVARISKTLSIFCVN